MKIYVQALLVLAVSNNIYQQDRVEGALRVEVRTVNIDYTTNIQLSFKMSNYQFILIPNKFFRVN